MWFIFRLVQKISLSRNLVMSIWLVTVKNFNCALLRSEWKGMRLMLWPKRNSKSSYWKWTEVNDIANAMNDSQSKLYTYENNNFWSLSRFRFVIQNRSLVSSKIWMYWIRNIQMIRFTRQSWNICPRNINQFEKLDQMAIASSVHFPMLI